MALKSGRVGIHPSQVDPITGMLLSSPSGSTNYNDLSNKPQINGVTLSGNKTSSDLHIEGASDLTDLDDVTISNPEAGQLLIYDGDKWENQFASISPVTPATLQSLQDVLISTPEAGQTLEYNATSEKWENVFASISPFSLSELRDVEISTPADGDLLSYEDGEWVNVEDNTNDVTILAVDLQNWSSDTTSQSGRTLYKKAISLNNVYVESPSIDIGAGTGYILPTLAEQTSYGLLQYATVDSTVPCLYLYANAIPTTAFYIKVKGVD